MLSEIIGYLLGAAWRARMRAMPAYPPPALTPDAFAQLSAENKRQGGHRALEPCQQKRIEYEGAQAQPGGAYTCGCGMPRLLAIQYDPSGDTGDAQQYHACADCDSVALQPRFLEV